MLLSCMETLVGLSDEKKTLCSDSEDDDDDDISTPTRPHERSDCYKVFMFEEPFELVVDEEQVIVGLDRAVATIKKGEGEPIEVENRLGLYYSKTTRILEDASMQNSNYEAFTLKLAEWKFIAYFFCINRHQYYVIVWNACLNIIDRARARSIEMHNLLGVLAIIEARAVTIDVTLLLIGDTTDIHQLWDYLHHSLMQLINGFALNNKKREDMMQNKQEIPNFDLLISTLWFDFYQEKKLLRTYRDIFDKYFQHQSNAEESMDAGKPTTKPSEAGSYNHDDHPRSRSPNGRSHGRSHREGNHEDDHHEVKSEKRREPNEKHHQERTPVAPSTTLVVNGSSQKIIEDDSYYALVEWGPLHHVRVIKERNSSIISRGFVFVDFPSVEAACKMLKGRDGER
eukprot:Gb_28165 [translate_table: standard]